MTKDEAITIHAKPENWPKFAVFVWQECDDLVTDVDGKIFRASNAFGLDSKLSDARIPAPRNLYFVDEPCYEMELQPTNRGDL